MNYKGDIIEESLKDKSMLDDVKILETRIEEVTEHHKTPWLKQWTLHLVEVPEEKAQSFAEKVKVAIETDHHVWYADYKNDKYHFIIFVDKIFKVDLADPTLYKDARRHGIALGIPEYQVAFTP